MLCLFAEYQMRVLADMLGEALEGEGGVAYITHNVGTSPYYARCYGPMTELAVNYLSTDIITADNISDFEPTQW